jgi:hypothetical protein
MNIIGNYLKINFSILERQISAANRDELLSVFNRYAHHEHLGERYMTPNEFLQDYLGYLKGDNIDPTTLNILSSLVDLNKDQSLFFLFYNTNT